MRLARFELPVWIAKSHEVIACLLCTSRLSTIRKVSLISAPEITTRFDFLSPPMGELTNDIYEVVLKWSESVMTRKIKGGEFVVLVCSAALQQHVTSERKSNRYQNHYFYRIY